MIDIEHHPVVEIIRVEEDTACGTLGLLKINKRVFCTTLEPADKLNRSTVSCIPAQQYRCRRVTSPRFGETFEVVDVPDRTHILFHPGNTLVDTQGCILVGQYWDKLRSKRGIANSGQTFRAFMAVVKGFDIFHLTIKAEY